MEEFFILLVDLVQMAPHVGASMELSVCVSRFDYVADTADRVESALVFEQIWVLGLLDFLDLGQVLLDGHQLLQ